MNKTNFVQTGGFPLNAERLEELETAYSIFNAYGALAGNFTIISGCVTSGSNVSDGYVYVNGELLAFKAGAVTPTSSVIIIEQKVNRPFENSEIKTVHTIRYATFGTAETSWLWSDFKRPMETKELIAALFLKADKTTTDNILTRLTTAEAKLATIAAGAEVNVASNWNVTDPLSDAYIHNKPTITNPFLYKGSVTIGDPDGKITRNVSFPDVGTSNYMVLGCLHGRNGNRSIDIGETWTIFTRTETSFVLGVNDVGGVQALDFYFAIVAL
ncbi:hypothetical protein [Flavobacterium aestivum]|uniref:hypothetical protein n=1 Tax=Flavobacterium aestivum TaxID=3003257 RepID=UPI0022854FE1|nr:hypothetical protein [Flavobacterium aestivum]